MSKVTPLTWAGFVLMALAGLLTPVVSVAAADPSIGIPHGYVVLLGALLSGIITTAGLCMHPPWAGGQQSSPPTKAEPSLPAEGSK